MYNFVYQREGELEITKPQFCRPHFRPNFPLVPIYNSYHDKQTVHSASQV